MMSLFKIAVTAALLLSTQSRAPVVDPITGDVHELTRSYVTSSSNSKGSKSSSNGSDTIVERVIAVRSDGVELEYDLPRDASADARARTWQFPARIIRSAGKPPRLQNGAELEARLVAWLKTAKLDRSACGRLIFTWNAFRIECDPQSVMVAIADYDLGTARPREGDAYKDASAKALGILKRTAPGIYTVVLAVDPDVLVKERAQTDVAVGELTQRPVTLDAAMRNRATEIVSGTVAVTFDTEATGAAWRRTRVVTLETHAADGAMETSIRTEIVTRRSISDEKPK